MHSVSDVSEKVFVDLSAQALLAQAVERGEGVLSDQGALRVETGARTGRSPKDRFIVEDALTEKTVNWGAINQSLSPCVFDQLWAKAEEYYIRLDEKYLTHLRVGENKEHSLFVKVKTELAWHALFAKHLFVDDVVSKEKMEWEIINVPSLFFDPARDGTHSDGVVVLNFTEKKILIAGIRYAGEMKKAMFTVLNFQLPEADILPMHCAANKGEDDSVALFFGLSGTGKTTLSADPDRFLIGDDEHGWGQMGVFNFEGGCYAKCIDLSLEREPMIWQAIRSGAIMENVIVDEKGVPNYQDDRLTKNTRAAYPRSHIHKRVVSNQAGQPDAVIFLTCDCYGVLPPVALLNKEQAAYYFLSGYTALVGSTELGSASDIVATFSTCFGAPFFPRPAFEYAKLLMRRICETGCQVYLINTGWTGGAYGQGGQRFPIPVTRNIVKAALSGELLNAPRSIDEGFGFEVPKQVKGVDELYLNPAGNWSDPMQFQVTKRQLIEAFQKNFKQFSVPAEIQAAGPSK